MCTLTLNRLAARNRPSGFAARPNAVLLRPSAARFKAYTFPIQKNGMGSAN
jgi:hypothetical protein